jgi:predicted aminopeptidase
MRVRRALRVLGLAALLAAGGLIGGCATLGYYGQAVRGHLSLLGQARPVADWLAEPDTPPALRRQLELSQQLRAYSVHALGLPDNRSYRAYADLKRGAVVWNVVAAPELSLTLKTWCFPLMGCVGYRGYFDRAGADALAAELRAQGWEVEVYGVPAYSTLGWTSWLGGDPLLNTFIGWPEAELARLLFHELAHQVAYAADDTAFNESFATAVERIGSARWLQDRPEARAAAELQDRRRADWRALMRRQRERLLALYADHRDGDDHRRQRKAELMAQWRAEYAALKRERWGGWDGYDGFVARANNASFGVQSAYDEGVPAFEALFRREGGDFARFYAQARRLAALPGAERRAELAALAGVEP